MALKIPLLVLSLVVVLVSCHAHLPRPKLANGKLPSHKLTGGVNTDQARFDYFVTVQKVLAIDPVRTAQVSGVLLTPNVILFGSAGGNASDFANATVTIGNSLGNVETKEMVEIKKTENEDSIFGEDYLIAVLNSPSTKVPVTIDDGTCVGVLDGCFEVTAVGRGRTEYVIPDRLEQDLEPTLSQVLQQIEVDLNSQSECVSGASAENLESVFADYYTNFLEYYFDCPGLQCDNVNQTLVDYYDDLFEDSDLDTYAGYYAAPFKNGFDVCFNSPNKDMCIGDEGAPVLISGTDIVIGFVFDNMFSDCLYAGQSFNYPTAVTLTRSLIDSIKADLQSLSGVVGTLDTPVSESECTCSSGAYHNMMGFQVLALLVVLATSFLQ